MTTLIDYISENSKLNSKIIKKLIEKSTPKEINESFNIISIFEFNEEILEIFLKNRNFNFNYINNDMFLHSNFIIMCIINLDLNNIIIKYYKLIKTVNFSYSNSFNWFMLKSKNLQLKTFKLVYDLIDINIVNINFGYLINNKTINSENLFLILDFLIKIKSINNIDNVINIFSNENITIKILKLFDPKNFNVDIKKESFSLICKNENVSVEIIEFLINNNFDINCSTSFSRLCKNKNVSVELIDLFLNNVNFDFSSDNYQKALISLVKNNKCEFSLIETFLRHKSFDYFENLPEIKNQKFWEKIVEWFDSQFLIK
jgi:hypothetical protein